MSPFTVLLAVTIAYGLLLSSGECCSATSHGRRRREATPEPSPNGAEDEGAQSNTDVMEKRGVKSRRPVMYDSHYKAFFNRLDANKDGQIDYSEGLLYFWAVDKNHDGLLEDAEFKKTKSY